MAVAPGRRVTLVAALVALTAALAPAVATNAETDRAGHASWRALDVWHFRYQTFRGRPYPVAITFRGNELRYPRDGVAAIAATADSAVVQVNDYGQKVGLGRLVELPGAGRAGQSLDRHPLGTVIADPNGHVAFWNSRRPDGPHLMALDTTTGDRVVGPAVKSRQRVFAVEGATAYVVDGVSRPDPVVSTWTPGQPALTPVPSGFTHGGITSDVSGERVLSFDFDDGLYVTDRAGTVLRTLPLFFGTFSPDSAHVVGLASRQFELFETETGARVRLKGLHGRKTSAARWSPGGVLVLDTIPPRAELYGTDDRVVTYACTPADGACRRLPGSVISEGTPIVPADALGQFFDYIPYS